MALLFAGLVVMLFLSLAKSQGNILIIGPYFCHRDVFHTVIPASFLFIANNGVSVNGSSAIGHCSSVTNSSGIITCTDPTSSVLFDGHIPTLTGLDGDMWASQLLTLRATTTLVTDIAFDFSDSVVVERIEVVMLNCPEWEMGVQTVTLFDQQPAVLATFNLTITSCDSLVRVCLALPTTSITYQGFTLLFSFSPNSDIVHLAEVAFYESGNTCLQDTIIIPTPENEAITTTVENMADFSIGVSTTSAGPCEECLSCFNSTLLASVLTAIITALLATAIFLPVLVAVRKCHPKFTPGGAETGTSARGGEEQEYEQIDMCEGGVARSDPTYMEAGTKTTGNTFALQQNEAYATSTLQS